ncbi:transglycosylase SLT domain-containing protein [Thalassospiraceae bacterium LMO-SO8]|nr:transglycosylase SLT domain-containing protein [Alphaproteobacteria bacterium LMO-S08]WND76815.1 transglycosylase SLT domain-containing protein [Thalassospiraceae bacterium LMO-SO8]
MAWQTRLFLCWLLAGALGWAPDALAARGQALENTDEICLEAARAVERREGIPANLLAAIALTESGRFDKESGENFAWPWTVTSQGKGRYFATEAEARAEVEILLSQGVRNIDVGCMQINMHYHWNAFETLDHAFDPAANAAYAAKFLKAKYDETRNWLTAAGQYHSQTPENFRPYRIKVLSYWNRLNRGDDETRQAKKDAGTDADDSRETTLVAVDTGRTARLNGLLKEKRRNERQDMQALGDTDRRRSHLDEWRYQKRRGVHLEAVVAQRIAEMEVRREEKMRDLDRATRDFTFAEKRRDQLDRWRRTGNLVGDTPQITVER